MTPSELFKSGQLSEAIDAQIKEVKTNPADDARRVFLFELLAFAGELDRAQRQVDVLNYVEPELLKAQIAYRKLLESERLRRRLFHDGLQPQFLAEAPEHVKLRLEVVNRLREKNYAEAAATLAQADAATPAVKGLFNGKPFTSLRDCDDLFSGVLEVMSQGTYFWLPFEQIDNLAMNAPKYPRDLLWFPAKLAVREGPEGDVFLPTLYPGTHEHADTELKLGRKSDWISTDQGPVLGVGLRMFLADDDAHSVLDMRELQMA